MSAFLRVVNLRHGCPAQYIHVHPLRALRVLHGAIFFASASYRRARSKRTISGWKLNVSPITHLLISWSLAKTGKINRRERAFVTLAGVVTDIDGAGLIFDVFRHGSDQPLQLWSKYHHIFGHNIGFGLLLAIAAFALSTRRWVTSVLVLVSFHVHLFCDLLGSKGPDGYQWPIPYLLPFSDAWQWIWGGQWQLNAWPNFAITIFTLLLALFFAWKNGVSPLEMVSSKSNRYFVDALRNRFGIPEGEERKKQKHVSHSDIMDTGLEPKKKESIDVLSAPPRLRGRKLGIQN